VLKGRVLSILSVALVVGACGSSTATPTTTASSVSSTGATTAPTTAGPVVDPNGIVSLAEAVAPSTLDPQESTLGADWFAWQLAYECLMTTDATGAIQPQLASGYTVSSDNLTYDFTLPSNVTFHNGDPFTADDVVYTFNRLNTEGIPLLKSRFYPNLTSVTAVSPTDVKFVLASADPNFIRNMANPGVAGCAIIDHNVPASSLAQKMVGTGPYEQTNYVPNQELDVKTYANYYGQKPANGGVKVLYIPDTLTQLADVKSGQVDIFYPPSTLLTQLSLDKTVTLASTVQDKIDMICINSSKAPFDNADVRRAIALAIDRNAIVTTVYSGAAVPTSYLPPPMTWAPKLADLPNSSLNIDMAKSLLASAGFPNGFSAHFMYIAGYSPEQTAESAVIQSQLSAIGVTITLDALQQAVWTTNLNKPDYDLAFNFYYGFVTPYEFLRVRTARTGPIPDSLKTLIDQLPAATTESSYQALMAKIETEEANLAYPNIPTVAGKAYIAYTARVGNLVVPPDGTRHYLTAVTVTTNP
jgi:peptide/nickel transport system substrate-binding protein